MQWTSAPRSRRAARASKVIRSLPVGGIMPPQDASTRTRALRPVVRRMVPALLLDVDVHEEPVPERLEDVEDETLLAVEKSKPDEVAINEVAHRTDEPT